jgi:hypothetical protein
MLLLGSIVIVAALAGATWLVWRRPSAINVESAARIREVMTLAEVEAILGGPARDDRSEPSSIRPGSLLSHDGERNRWMSDVCTITVYFEQDGRVGAFVVDASDPESPLDMVRRLLGL